MSDTSETAGDPEALLADTHALVSRVRQAQRTTWSALLVLGVTVLLAIPFYAFGDNGSVHCQTGSAGRIIVCARYPTLLAWYWPVALVIAYAVIGAMFVRQARARGVGARVGPYVIIGIVLVAVATLISIWLFLHPLAWGDIGGLHLQPGSPAQHWLGRLISPVGVIGLGLLVLARVERSRGLAIFSVLYLLVVLATAVPATHSGPPSRWVFLPGILIPGLVLLAGSAVFAVLERPAASGAP